jgi:oligopeptide transport system substrate-binding protein
LPYDPEQAQRLLAEAGYPGGRGFPAVDTLAPRVVEARVTYLQSQWREILGVEVAWQTPEWATFLDQLNNERHHLFCAMWVADYPDPDNFLRVSRTETWAGWQNERYDRLVGEARRVMEQEERMKRYRQAEEILVAEAPILPLTYEREHLLIKPWISYYPTTASRAVFWKDVVIAPRA